MTTMLMSSDAASASSLSALASQHAHVSVLHTWTVECYRDGELVWADTFKNVSGAIFCEPVRVTILPRN